MVAYRSDRDGERWEPVERALLEQPADAVAPQLLGKLLVRRFEAETVVARLVEVEAYCQDDPASHSARGRTARNAAMFHAAGTAYVYISYGIHRCLNVVTGREGEGAAVLLRAARIEQGHDTVQRLRATVTDRAALLQGPGCLGSGLAVTLADGGVDLLTTNGDLVLADDGWQPTTDVCVSGPRVGVSRARDRPWRWWIQDAPEVSRFRR